MKLLKYALCLASGILTQTGLAQVPQLINYQGRVTVNGAPFNGSGQFEFALVNTGASISYWSNDGSSAAGGQPSSFVVIPVSNGLYSVFLGDTSLNNMSSLSPAVFSSGDVLLRVWFNDGTHGFTQMSPDQRVGSVGYAMMAATVPSGAITGANLAGNTITAANLAPGAASANLQASGQAGVPSGGIVLSTSASSPNLQSDGYSNIGSIQSTGESWRSPNPANPPAPRAGHVAVWTGNQMIVWGGLNSSYLNDGAIYDPVANTWTALPTDSSLEPREYHSAIWTGSLMIIWGGYDNGTYVNDGASYNLAANTWTPVSSVNAPDVRDAQSAVWTGTEMIIWGGYNNNSSFHLLNTGGRYNPSTDSWISTSTNGAPSARLYQSGFWTGSQMIIWGGRSNTGYFNTGGVYNPANDTWTAMSTVGAPAARFLHVAVWTGSQMIVWGGYGTNGYLNDGGIYTLASDSWAPLSTNNVPGPRYSAAAVWTGSEMAVWGGYDFGCLQDGARYNPVNNAWTTMTSTNAPAARQLHTAVWTGSQMLVFGGEGSSTNYLNDVDDYSPSQTLYLYLKP